MFTDTEKALLDNPGPFPLLRAASAAAGRKGCPTCRHAAVNVHGMIRAAINKYKTDKRFLDHCASLFRLPARAAGVTIGQG